MASRPVSPREDRIVFTLDVLPRLELVFLGREILLQRYTEPSSEIKLLLDVLGLQLPSQPPPRITEKGDVVM